MPASGEKSIKIPFNVFSPLAIVNSPTLPGIAGKEWLPRVGGVSAPKRITVGGLKAWGAPFTVKLEPKLAKFLSESPHEMDSVSINSIENENVSPKLMSGCPFPVFQEKTPSIVSRIWVWESAAEEVIAKMLAVNRAGYLSFGMERKELPSAC